MHGDDTESARNLSVASGVIAVNLNGTYTSIIGMIRSFGGVFTVKLNGSYTLVHKMRYPGVSTLNFKGSCTHPRLIKVAASVIFIPHLRIRCRRR